MTNDNNPLKESLVAQVSDSLGLMPNFFRSVAASGLAENLWAFAKSAYIDSPLPSLFKERLFVHLSRFSEVRYCVVRHAGFLVGEGRPAGDPEAAPETVEDVMALLRRPLPDANALNQALTRLEARRGPVEIPSPRTQFEADLFDALAVMFVEPCRSGRAQTAVRHAIGDASFDVLTAYLSFIHTTHYWTETHPDIPYEPDVLALMERRHDLAKLLLDTSEAERVKAGEALRKALMDLRQTQDSLQEQEVRLRTALEAGRMATWRWDPVTDQVTASDTLDDLVGVSWGTVFKTGAQGLGLLHPDDQERHRLLVEASARHGGGWHDEYRVMRPRDGRAIWMEERARAIRDPKTGQMMLDGIVWDITERKEAERALQQSEERFRSALEIGTIGVVFFDESGRITDANDSFMQMVGLTREDIDACHIRYQDLTPPEWGWKLEGVLAELKATGQSAPSEKELFRKDGSRIWIHYAGKSLGHGSAVEFVLDVTDRKRTDAELREAQERLQNALAAGRMAAWHWDQNTDVVIEAESVRELFGVAPGDPWQSSEHGLALVHPDDRERHRQIIETARRDGAGWHAEFRVIRPHDGQVVWLEERSHRRIDPQTGKATITGLIWDVTARKQAETALRESEERLRLIVENARDYAIFMMDPQGVITDWLPGAAAILGWTAEEITGQSAVILFTPEDREAAIPEQQIYIAQKRGVSSDVRWHLRKDGGRVFIDGSVVALRTPRGNLRGFLKIGQDVTERRAAEEQVARSEALFRTLATGIQQLVFLGMPNGSCTWASPQWSEYTGLDSKRTLGFGWLDALHPDDRTPTLQRWAEAPAAGEIYLEHRVRRADGAYRWHQTRAKPLDPHGGMNSEWVGAMTDVHDLRDLQEQQEVLVAELQHRTRNLIGVVRSVSERTLAGSSSLEDFKSRFNDRVAALARVQGLLSRKEPGQRVTFDELIRTELLGLGALDMEGDGPLVTLEGPVGVRLRSATVQTLALGLHELATNAIKYGALSHSGGRLRVRWRVERGAQGEAWLNVDWRESGAVVALGSKGAPLRHGYGRELIERALPYQLQAKTRYELRAEGVRCTITMPLPADLSENVDV